MKDKCFMLKKSYLVKTLIHIYVYFHPVEFTIKLKNKKRNEKKTKKALLKYQL